MSTLTLKPSPVEGYDLLHEGTVVASVVKRTRHYNIAPRGITVTYWRVTGDYGDRNEYGTRRDAVSAVQARVNAFSV